MKFNRTLAAATVAAVLAAPVFIDKVQAQPGPMGPGYGMGPGMMGGYGPGYGMGPGMMGGYGPGYGMGHGWGWGPGAVNLTDAQRSQITEISREAARKQWELMGKVHEQQYRLNELYESGKAEDAAARKVYDAMVDAHKQMFDIQLEARKKIDAVLTPEQREELRQRARGRWGAPGGAK
jgi:Spy/CpxP family protein refolding chaperone